MSSTEPTSANGSQEAAAADASVIKALSTDVEGLEEDNVVYDLSDEDDEDDSDSEDDDSDDGEDDDGSGAEAAGPGLAYLYNEDLNDDDESDDDEYTDELARNGPDAGTYDGGAGQEGEDELDGDEVREPVVENDEPGAAAQNEEDAGLADEVDPTEEEDGRPAKRVKI